MKLLSKIACTVCIVVVALGSARAQNLFLNEFHYDNTGADVNEFVEFALDSSLNINLVSVVLYNGNDGTAYTTTPGTSFTLGGTSNGFDLYSFTYPSGGIQNGAPDGIAIGYNGVLVSGQFLSYEGSFVGVGGIAAGVTSTDIGLSEPGTGPTTGSLGLIGTGSQYSDFTWTTFTTNSKGLPNAGQTFVVVPEPSVYMLLGVGLLFCGQRYLRRRRA